MSGDGSIYKRQRTRPNGETYTRWVAQASFGGRADRRIVRRVCRTRAEARAQLEELMRPRPVSKLALGTYLRAWLDEREDRLAYNTTRGYRAVVPHWGPILDIPLGELTAEDVSLALRDMRLGARTRRNALGALRTALADAERRGHVQRNVARLVAPPRVPKPDHDAMTFDTAKAILAATKDTRYAAAIALGLCGLRIAETLGLSWSDVDLGAGTVTIRNQLAGSGKRAKLAPTKTPGSAAVVALPAFAAQALRDHRVAQLAERLAAGVPTGEGLVFVTKRGWPVHQGEVNDQLRKALETAGLPPMSFHGLRHGVASLLAAAGVHPRVIQAYLRHANVRISMDVYTHVNREQERVAADTLGVAIGGVG
jgi:integrase